MIHNDEPSQSLDYTNKNISTVNSSALDIDVKSHMLDNKLSDMKKMMTKMYALQKRLINGEKVSLFYREC